MRGRRRAVRGPGPARTTAVQNAPRVEVKEILDLEEGRVLAQLVLSVPPQRASPPEGIPGGVVARMCTRGAASLWERARASARLERGEVQAETLEREEAEEQPLYLVRLRVLGHLGELSLPLACNTPTTTCCDSVTAVFLPVFLCCQPQGYLKAGRRNEPHHPPSPRARTHIALLRTLVARAIGADRRGRALCVTRRTRGPGRGRRPAPAAGGPD